MRRQLRPREFGDLYGFFRSKPAGRAGANVWKTAEKMHWKEQLHAATSTAPACCRERCENFPEGIPTRGGIVAVVNRSGTRKFGKMLKFDGRSVEGGSLG